MFRESGVVAAIGFCALHLLLGCSSDRKPDSSKASGSDDYTSWINAAADQAIAESTNAITKNPQDSQAYISRGRAYDDKGEYDKAIADFTRVIEMDPTCAKSYQDRAIAYARKGLIDPALSDCSKAIELNPKDPEAYGIRATVRLAQGQYDQAIADHNAAIATSPTYGRLYIFKAWTCEKAGRTSDAIASYKAFIQYAVPRPNDTPPGLPGPDDMLLDTAKKRLARLEAPQEESKIPDRTSSSVMRDYLRGK